MTTTEKRDPAAIAAEHSGDHLCHIEGEMWHQADQDGECEAHSLAAMASEQAAALDLMSKQFKVMQREKEHGWREAEKWEDKADRLAEQLSEQTAALAQPNLGLATTAQLLDELRVRIEVDYLSGGGGLGYSTVGGRAALADDQPCCTEHSGKCCTAYHCCNRCAALAGEQ